MLKTIFHFTLVLTTSCIYAQNFTYTPNYGTKTFEDLVSAFVAADVSKEEAAMQNCFHPYKWYSTEDSGQSYHRQSKGKRFFTLVAEKNSHKRQGYFILDIMIEKGGTRRKVDSVYFICRQIKGQWCIVEITENKKRLATIRKLEEEAFDNFVDTFVTGAQSQNWESLQTDGIVLSSATGLAEFTTAVSANNAVECARQFNSGNQGYFAVEVFGEGKKLGTFFALAAFQDKWQMTTISSDAALVSDLKWKQYTESGWGINSAYSVRYKMESAIRSKNLEKFMACFHPDCWRQEGSSGQWLWQQILDAKGETKFGNEAAGADGKSWTIAASIASETTITCQLHIQKYSETIFAISAIIKENGEGK